MQSGKMSPFSERLKDTMDGVFEDVAVDQVTGCGLFLFKKNGEDAWRQLCPFCGCEVGYQLDTVDVLRNGLWGSSGECVRHESYVHEDFFPLPREWSLPPWLLSIAEGLEALRVGAVISFGNQDYEIGSVSAEGYFCELAPPYWAATRVTPRY